MALALSTQDPSTFTARCRALAQRLDGGAALIFAGGYKAMNYTANAYPYRADSHFLYLTGAGIPDATLLVTDAGAELFMEPPPEDDALWHGEVPGWDEIAKATGVDRVRDVAELAEAISAAGGSAKVGTLPSADPMTRLRQSSYLERPWSAPDLRVQLQGADGALADAMISARLVHDAGAIEKLRQAAEGTTAAHLAGMRATAVGRYEHEVRAAMEAQLLARGMRTSYPPIVTTHGHVLHNNEYHHQMQDGDMMLADVGADCDGWAGDVTRTWPVNGKFSATQRAFYDIVLQAELDAIAQVQPGKRYRDVHLTACRTLTQGLVDEGVLVGDVDNLVERGAHALLFPHGVGHLIGLDVHDMEDLGDRAGYAPGRSRSEQFGLGYLRLDRDLQAGMCVTIEPGLYLVPAILEHKELCAPFDADKSLNREALARFSDVRGIRIEDDVLCTESGPEVLTKDIPKTADAVEAEVGLDVGN
jgi:Xaa-Pro aminopeptidase